LQVNAKLMHINVSRFVSKAGKIITENKNLQRIYRLNSPLNLKSVVFPHNKKTRPK
jgi:hypothetical protein